MASIKINKSYAHALAYLDEFVDLRPSGKSKQNLYVLVAGVIRRQKHYWKKINVDAYAMGFYFSIHERWFLCSCEHLENFDIKSFHEAYWVSVALRMQSENYGDDHISDVFHTAMINFLTIPYKLNYKVIVPFLCALVGGKSGSTKKIDALIVSLTKAEQECLKNASRLASQTVEIPDAKINEILAAKDQFSKLIYPLIFNLKKKQAFIVAQQPVAEPFTTLESSVPAEEQINHIDVRKEETRETNTTSSFNESYSSGQPEPIHKNANLDKNTHELKVSNKSQSVKPTNKSTDGNRGKIFWIGSIITLLILSFLIFFSGRSATINKPLKSPMIIEKNPEEEIKCLTLERKLTLIRPLANNPAQKVIISDLELEQSNACRNISRTTPEYEAAKKYVKEKDEEIKSLVLQALEQATERPNENMHNNMPEMKQGGSLTVYEAQVALRKLGYDIIPDGFEGPNTQIAVTEFQKKIGLAQTGKIDKELMIALSAELTLESL